MKYKIKYLLLIIFFLCINVVFNFRLWGELFSNKITVSDNIITEFLVETSYQNVLHFKNPFITNSILYPFTTNFSMNDSSGAYVLPFFFLRPFFDPHRSLLLITLLGFFLNNFFMYLLLRKLKVGQGVSMLVALIFGFTPFLSYRIMGHYTYIPIYFFPLIFLTVNRLLETKESLNKYLISLLIGLLMALILLSNFYYFFMIVLAMMFFVGYWLLSDRRVLSKLLKENISYFLISGASIVFSLIPWIISVYQLIKTEGLTKTPGFGGAIPLSADMFSLFTPSEYNPIYKLLISELSSIIPIFSKYENFFLNNWERFSYPGIIILVSYLIVILLRIFKRLPEKLWQNIKPYFAMSFVFFILALGPFLKIFNHWFVSLDGVAVFFPLPFLIFHYIPGLSTLRASSRFTPMFIFFACLVIAYLVDHLSSKLNKKRRTILLMSLFLIFFFDQFYVIPTKLNQKIPTKIYYYLKDRPQGTVLEIPFTVRDGFQYIGFVHAIQSMAGQLIHGKPIMGGYIARVNQSVFDYYKNLKFIGYLAKIIDKGNYNPLTEKPKGIIFFPYEKSYSEVKSELNYLKIKYVILKVDEKYSKYLENLFLQIGYRKTNIDNDYVLLET